MVISDIEQWLMMVNGQAKRALVAAKDSLNGVRVTAMQPHTLADRMAYFATRVTWCRQDQHVQLVKAEQ